VDAPQFALDSASSNFFSSSVLLVSTSWLQAVCVRAGADVAGACGGKARTGRTQRRQWCVDSTQSAMEKRGGLKAACTHET
jgi:hypothetical protein